MGTGVSTATMKILFNSKGSSLVVLLIAITLISVLGASFVSLMSSKQKGFLHQLDSYRALNIANAGMEHAIRYAFDEIGRQDSPLFARNPYDSPVYNFHGGTFWYRYAYSEIIADDLLTVNATYRGSERRVRLRRFRDYAFENLSLVPGKKPFLSANTLVIPIVITINRNNDPSLSITRIDISISFTGGGSSRNLERIYMSDTEANYFQTVIYDYALGGTDPSPLPIPPLQSINLMEPYSVPLWADPPANTANSRRWCTFQFVESGSLLSGVYTVGFALMNGQYSILRFTL